MGDVASIATRSVPADDTNFDEGGYLSANPDVALAVNTGKIGSGRAHFEKFGRAERREIRIVDGDLSAMRAAKLARLAPLLRLDMPHVARDGKLDFLTRELAASTAISDVDAASGHGYDAEVLALIEANADFQLPTSSAGLLPRLNPP